MNFKDKYTYHKSKYLNLKNNSDIYNQNTIKQVGGKIFQKKQLLYIVATISQRKLKHGAKEITDKLLGTNVKPYRAPHITLLNLIINDENPENIIFQNKTFYNKIKEIYAETIASKKNPLILQTKPFPGAFSFPGFKPRYFLKNYEQLDSQNILEFRNKFFALIEKRLGDNANIKNYIDKSKSKYHIYSYNDQELFAESSYYDSWKPHIDFLNEFDIQKHNPSLYHEINQKQYGNQKVKILKDEIKDLPQEIFTKINMGKQMRNITYAIDHIIQKKFKI